MRKQRIKLYSLIVTLLLSSIFMADTYANNPPKNHSLESNDIAEFVDNIIPGQLKEYNIPGASVAIVKDGKLLFKRGYGYRDKSKGLGVDTDTMFRIGSVTKVFTWTAIMQLVEQGKISLDDNISMYLNDIELIGDYKNPITIRNLMTHTSGLEDRFSNLFMTRDDEIPPLAHAIRDDLRHRIYDPDEIIAYSNYGTALAGLIIEKVSGMTYGEYIQEHILDPLDMNRTTILQPASSGYDNVSKGHIYSKGKYKVFEDAFTGLPPIGAISTSAEDIARFMIMHLNDGSYRDLEILSEGTSRLMKTTAYTSDDRLPGICLGFMEWKRNGQRIVWHSGGTALFKTLFLLIPDDNIGIFISYNSPNSGDARDEFRQEFLDRYYPFKISEPEGMKGYKERVKEYEGYYKEGRNAIYNSDKLIYALSRVEKAEANDDGTLTFRKVRYIETEPLVFKEVDGQGLLIFKKDTNDNIKYAFQDFEPHEAYIRLKWYETPTIALLIFAICYITFLVGIVIRAIYRVINKKHRTAGEIAIDRLITTICALHLVFPIGALLGFMIEIYCNPRVMATGAIPYMFKLSLLAPALGGVLTFIALSYLVKGTKKNQMSLKRRGYNTVIILASIIYIVWLYYFNLLGTFK